MTSLRLVVVGRVERCDIPLEGQPARPHRIVLLQSRGRGGLTPFEVVDDELYASVRVGDEVLVDVRMVARGDASHAGGKVV